jgi:hypothetical protein
MEPIDYVVTYVDGTDPVWQESFKQRMHGLEPASASKRYRDMDTIRFAFRGIEKFMPWINNVYLIVQGSTQMPVWLNLVHPKLKIIFHDEFIPKEFLPTFNSNVIEMFVHNLPDLSENFIIANDDMIPVHPMTPDMFFRDGRPVYKKTVVSENYELESTGVFKHIKYNNTTLQMKFLNTNKRIAFHHYHLLMPYKLSFWKLVWHRLGNDILNRLKNSPMRTSRNVNHWLISDLQMLEGITIDDQNLNTKGYCCLDNDMIKNDVFRTIHGSNVICLNDSITNETTKYCVVEEALNQYMPEPSLFEV